VARPLHRKAIGVPSLKRLHAILVSVDQERRISTPQSGRCIRRPEVAVPAGSRLPAGWHSLSVDPIWHSIREHDGHFGVEEVTVNDPAHLLLRIHPRVRPLQLDQDIRKGNPQRPAVCRPVMVRRDQERASFLVALPRCDRHPASWSRRGGRRIARRGCPCRLRGPRYRRAGNRLPSDTSPRPAWPSCFPAAMLGCPCPAHRRCCPSKHAEGGAMSSFTMADWLFS